MKRTAFRQIRPAFPPKLRDREPSPPPTVKPLVRGAYASVGEVVAQPKEPADRNMRLRELAKGETCCVCMGRYCDPQTSVWGHTNSQRAQKGMAYKARDSKGFFVGATCHEAIDKGRATAEERDQLVAIGQFNTRERLAQIATDPLSRPWKREAARWALEQLKEHV